MKRNFKNLSVPAAVLLCYLLLSAKPDLSRAVPELLGLSGAVVLLIVLAQWMFSKQEDNPPISPLESNGPKAETPCEPWSPAFIVLFSALVRILFLFDPPSLSDDIYRYCLDGVTLLAGDNPYTFSPKALQHMKPGLAPLISLVNHPHLLTLYPPGAQIIYGAGALAAGMIRHLSLGHCTGTASAVLGMKLIVVAMDTATCAFIIAILGKMRLPRRRAVLYAWHPLCVIETGASGHIDAAALFFLTAAVYAAMRFDSPKAARGSVIKNSAFIPGILVALSVLTKWIPLLFIPGFLWLFKGQRQKTAAAVTIVLTITMGCALFWPDIMNSFSTLGTYLGNWEFSGFLFRTARNVMAPFSDRPGTCSRMVLAALFILCAWKILFSFQKDGTTASALRSFHLMALSWLILTPTLYPWYMLYLTAFLPFSMSLPGTVFSWSVLLSYKVMMLHAETGQWVEDDTTAFLIIAAPVSAYLLKGIFIKGGSKTLFRN